MGVFVVGALHLDVIVDAPRLPRLDETLVGSGVTYAFGGKGGNQAAAAARMGADTTMAGRVGSDGFADTLLAALDGAGVGRTQVRRVTGASGMSVAVVEASGGYGAVIVSGANAGIDAAEIAIPEGAGILVLQNEIPEPANVALAQAARARGIGVVLNAAPARPVDCAWPDLCTLLVVNRVEAADMTGTDDPAVAAALLARRGHADVVVTLGADGLIWCAGDVPPVALSAFPVTPVSSHGAGDAFVGALAARLDRGDDLAGALPFAQAAAALHVATPPDRRGAIDAVAVARFMKRC